MVNGPEQDRPQPTRDEARARARAEERTRELPTRRAQSGPRASGWIVAVVVAAIAGFGLGAVLTDGEDRTVTTVESTSAEELAEAIEDHYDPSTTPAGNPTTDPPRR